MLMDVILINKNISQWSYLILVDLVKRHYFCKNVIREESLKHDLRKN